MEIHAIFPTPVYENNIDRPFTKEEMDFVFECEKDCHKNEGNMTSNNNYVLEKEPMKDIKKFLDLCVKQYILEVIRPKFDIDIRITQSWFNYTKPGEYHHRHSHPNSYISGVLYFNADPEKDMILFHKKEYYMYILNIPPIQDHDFNCSSMWFSSKPGKVLLFPSTLEHNVKVTESEETRISLAFNTFLSGIIGNDENLTGLKL
jgi:uncharacterized protein (TIGR02466 family)